MLYGAFFLSPFVSGAGIDLIAGVLMLVAHWPERRFQRHYVILAAAVICASLVYATSLICILMLELASLDVFLSLADFARPFALVVVGAYFLVGGIFDHLLLVRTFKTVPEER